MKFKVLAEKVSKVSPKHPCGCGTGIKTPIGMI